MKTSIRLARTFAALSAVGSVPLTTGFANNEPPVTSAVAASAKAEPQRHPLKGVIVDVLAAQSALVVKHDEIPGYMMAMTMAFKVDAAALQAAGQGQAITGMLVERPDGLWLEDMKPASR